MFLLTLVSPVYAQDEPVNITELPAQLAIALGVSEFIAGLLISVAIVLITVLPVVVATKGRTTMYGLYLFVGLLVLAPLVALGWTPVWLYVIIVIALAIGLARQLSDAIGGNVLRR